MFRVIIVVSAVVVLVASGAVHGVWTDRWSDRGDLVEIVNRLDELPLTIGDWHGSNVEMEQDPKNGLAGVIVRRYIHAKNGKSVTLFLGCGRSGPVCTHTPEVCYAGSGFEVEKPKRYSMSAGGAEFWTARFVRERNTGKTHLRIFWSWHGADGWKVADNPRVRFAGEKSLYKMYLIREMVTPDEPMESDACVEFMNDVLPAFRESVLQ
jgi:hypothetical protein